MAIAVETQPEVGWLPTFLEVEEPTVFTLCIGEVVSPSELDWVRADPTVGTGPSGMLSMRLRNEPIDDPLGELLGEQMVEPEGLASVVDEEGKSGETGRRRDGSSSMYIKPKKPSGAPTASQVIYKALDSP
ncbi:hypothetical protein Fot_29068 [Forsythia ovata]|uniref:Uncharacterized protein n=1 Tax=Forsythia ovata TaxID=205694 RepID=A0ABD1TQW3_9LAMI